MKGSIFTQLLHMIETEEGHAALDHVISESIGQLSTDGAYTAVGNYPHSELLVLLGNYSAYIQPSRRTDLLDRFAGYIIREFGRLHPEYFQQSDIFQLLESVESHIHKAVLVLYPNANPPQISCKRDSDLIMRVHYRSHRPLAEFALSLSRESAKLFPEPTSIELVSMAEQGCEAEYLVRRLS